MYEADERDVSVLKAVLPLMSRHAAGYHPISYTVWYEYSKGTNQGLRQDIDTELKRIERLTVPLTYSFYTKHLVEPAQRVILSARSGLLDLVGKVKTAVQEVDQGASAFDAHLNTFQKDLASATTIEDLDTQVSSLLAESQRFSQGFGKLATELDERKNEVRRLTDELSQLREDAQTDSLSGLLNRRGFDRELERMTSKDAAGSCDLAVIMFDIDHFKKINDTYGHPLGDVVISAVGRVIRECLGSAGVAARYGGEEFVVLLPQKTISAAQDIAEAIRKRVAEGKIRRRHNDNPIAGVTISAGVAAWYLTDDPSSLIERADLALYASKRAGRNCVTVYNQMRHAQS